MLKRLESKVAIVTGASRGIGAAIARRLASEGAAIVLGFLRDSQAAHAVADEIGRLGGRARPFRADIADPSATTQLVDAAMAHFGRLDILVNNAAVGANQPLTEIDFSQAQQQLTANIIGPALTIQRAASYLSKQGGAIVNITSLNARLPAAGASLYSASKAAVEAMTKSLAKELGPHGVRVNAVAPGLTATEKRLAKLTPDLKQQIIEHTPLRRLGTPEDIASVVAFLASDDAGWITGETLVVSGGYGI